MLLHILYYSSLFLPGLKSNTTMSTSVWSHCPWQLNTFCSHEWSDRATNSCCCFHERRAGFYWQPATSVHDWSPQAGSRPQSCQAIVIQVTSVDPAVFPIWMHVPAASQIYKGICEHIAATSLSQALISTEKKEGMTVCSSTQWRALSLQSSQDTRGNIILIPSFTTALRKKTCNIC